MIIYALQINVKISTYPQARDFEGSDLLAYVAKTVVVGADSAALH